MYVAIHIAKVLHETDSYKSGKFEKALKDTFMELDKNVLDKNTEEVGNVWFMLFLINILFVAAVVIKQINKVRKIRYAQMETRGNFVLGCRKFTSIKKKTLIYFF